MSASVKSLLRTIFMATFLIAGGCREDPAAEKNNQSELSGTGLSSQDIACISGVGSAVAWAKSCGSSTACYIGAALGGAATLIGCYDKTKIDYYRSCACISNQLSPIIEQDANHITRKGWLYCPNQPIGIPYDCRNIIDLRAAG